MDRLILHCDLNNFYASVESIGRPELKDVPFAVCGDPEQRHGIILAKNEEAKKYDIKTGDVLWQARQKCPQLIVSQPHFDKYMKYSKAAFEIYTRYTPLVEPFGADECWLDCTGSQKLFGSGKVMADNIRQKLKDELCLSGSVGVSFTKVFAKLASDMKKPDATTVIDKENYKRLVWKLPVRDLLMIGKATEATLVKLNINTIGALAQADTQLLKKHLGVNGIKLKNSASGMESEGVREAVKSREAQSVGHGMTAVKDLTDYGQCRNMIYVLSEMVCARLRKNGFRAGQVSVTMRDCNLQTQTRQKYLKASTYSSNEIAQAAFELLKEHWDKTPLRTITVSTSKLSAFADPMQMSMFEDVRNKKMEQLELAIDKINQKYGAGSIKRASLIGLDFVYDKTEEEDFLPFQR